MVVLISVLCGIYTLLVVVLRKQDKKDVEKVGLLSFLFLNAMLI